MYRDNTLVPSEAIRLLALGTLATREMTYAELAAEVRHFAAHVVGPSLELVATPIEILKIEGLVENVYQEDAAGENALLRITETGRDELMRLLNSNVRAPVSDVNKLIITLKMRFLHLLDPKDQKLQCEIMTEMCERQLVRLTELRAHHVDAPGQFNGWLDQEIAQACERLDWFRDLDAKIGQSAAALREGAVRR